MNWDSVERRESAPSMKFCPAHINQVADMAVIKNSLLNIENVITTSSTFKTGFIVALLTISLTLVIQIIIFAYLYGGLVKQVDINTVKLNKTEDVAKDVKANLKEQLDVLRAEILNLQQK